MKSDGARDSPLLLRLMRSVLRLLACNTPFPALRHALLRASGVRIGEHAFVNMNVLFVDGYRTGAIRIGDRAAIAPGVVLVASSDPNNSTLRRFAEYVVRGTVTVEADAWVGVGAILLPNIVVGEASIVGAGAVVTKDVPAGTVVAGVPAMPMGSVGRRYHQDGRGTS